MPALETMPASSTTSTARRPLCERCADHGVSAGLPRLPSGGECERLAGPGLPDHHGHRIALSREATDHLGLLAGDRRPPADRTLDRAVGRESQPGLLAI